MSVGFISQRDNPQAPGSYQQIDKNYPRVFKLDNQDKEWIENTLSNMTLREKCAQMIIAPVYRSFMDSTSVDYDSTIELVRDYKIGGLIMFQGELKQEINFIKKMQALSDIPLLISADYERGLGMRIDDALEFPHSMALGATTNSQLAYEMGKAIAVESRLIGVYQNFAPVADINNDALNPVINIRSFSESKFTVAEFVSSFLLGAKHGRIISTAKHFPGHGNTDIDSHTELPLISGDKNYLFQNELYPFIQAINSGVQAIMVGHPIVQAFDTLPAPLSKNIVTGLLINTLGFDGLIITDALNMKAINNHYSLEETILLAVKAGNDIILMPLDPRKSISIIYNAVLNGEITEERIDNSVRKILSAKRWLKIDSRHLSTETIVDSIKKFSHKELAQSIADKSITLLKNDAGIIPLDLTRYNNIYCVTVTDGTGDETATFFQNIITRRLGNINSILITDKTKKRELKNYLGTLHKADLIVMPIFMEVKETDGKEKLREDQIKFIKKVLNLRAPVITMSFKNPYLLNLIPQARTYLNAYSYTKVSQKACLKALLGEIDISGKLPVSIPQTEFHIGMGININKTTSTELSYAIDVARFKDVEQLLINFIKEENSPPTSIIVGYEGKIIYQKSFGLSDSLADSSLIKQYRFNLGSLTSPIVLTSAIMLLADNDSISLSDKVSHHLPEFQGNGKDDIAIKNLLANNSGIGNSLDSLSINWSRKELETALMNLSLAYSVGYKTEPSDLNTILLQLIVEKISGKSLDEFVNESLFKPLGIGHTSFEESASEHYEYFIGANRTKPGSPFSQSEIIKKIMSNVAGFDGLYSTTEDLAIFAQMMIQNGYYDGKQYFSASTLNQFTASKLSENYPELGWHTYLSESNISRNLSNTSFGYNSDNGSSVWIDPAKKMFIILLTNSDIDKTKILIPKLHEEIIKITIDK